jgi:hypothetical protein
MSAVGPSIQRRDVNLRGVRSRSRGGCQERGPERHPEGELLYRTRGFTWIGEGITWWLHFQ